MNIIELAKKGGAYVSAGNTVIKFTSAELQAFANDVLEEAQADLVDALIADCENGVKWINESASREFKRKYPELDNTIKGMKL